MCGRYKRSGYNPISDNTIDFMHLFKGLVGDLLHATVTLSERLGQRFDRVR